MTHVVTGEAVALDLRPARVPSRALALLVDVVAMGVLLIGVLVLVALAGDSFDPALAAALFLAVAVLVLVGWPTAWETLTRGRSPGKYAMGLRVVRDDGGPIRFRHAFTRALTGLVVDFGVLSGGTGVVAVVVSASSARGKRVGDLLAGTVVLRERVPREASATGALPPVHPQLAAWATGLELTALPDDLALSARRFLLRAPALESGVRWSLGTRLADDVAARVAPAPPPGVPPEVYLAAVLGERLRRDVARTAAGLPHGPSTGAPPYGPPWSASAPSAAPAPGGGATATPWGGATATPWDGATATPWDGATATPSSAATAEHSTTWTLPDAEVASPSPADRETAPPAAPAAPGAAKPADGFAPPG